MLNTKSTPKVIVKSRTLAGKTELLKKLLALIIIGFFFSVSSNAQIVYHQGGFNISCSNYCDHHVNTDVNADAVSDLTIGISTAPGHVIAHYEIPPNASVTASGDNGSYFSFDSLSTSDTIIGSDLTWQSTQVSLRSCGNPCLGWQNESNHYLPLKIVVANQSYYGWIQLYVSASTSPLSAFCSSTGFAYNTIPDRPILAGETSCTAPTVSIKASGSLSFCKGDSVILTAKTSAYLFQWQKSGRDISGATNSIYVAKKTGKYKVAVMNSCGDATSKVEKVSVTCRQSDEYFSKPITVSNSVIVTPNPLTQSTTISFSLSQSENVSIKIFDLEGRLIRTLAQEVISAGTQTLTWDAHDENGNAVSAGIYFLKIQSQDFSPTEKLIVVK